MPGHLWDVRCRGCGARSEISAGAGYDRRRGGLFGFSQYGCAACGRLTSVRTDEIGNGIDSENSDESIGESGAASALLSCPSCGGPLTPWAGVVGHYGERPSKAHGLLNERLLAEGRKPIGELICRGPCPRCETALTARKTALWD